MLFIYLIFIQNFSCANHRLDAGVKMKKTQPCPQGAHREKNIITSSSSHLPLPLLRDGTPEKGNKWISQFKKLWVKFEICLKMQSFHTVRPQNHGNPRFSLEMPRSRDSVLAGVHVTTLLIATVHSLYLGIFTFSQSSKKRKTFAN